MKYRKFLLLPGGALLLAALLIFGSSRPRAVRSSENETVLPQIQSPLDGRVIGHSGRRVGEAVSVVRFALYDVGILPRSARVAPGWVALHLELIAGGGNADLIVERIESGEARGEAIRRITRHREADRPRWVREEIRLTEGRYRLSRADNPDISAELIVEP